MFSAAVVLSLLSNPASLFSATVTPVYDVRFFGGQHFFDGDVSSVSGNLNVMISPAVKFNDRWSVIPTYSGGYRGTRDVQELAGGGTLFQDSTSHGVNVKGVFSATPAWKLKATAGARYEFLRETKDESWGDGLFDYGKYTGGLETQYDFSKGLGGRLAYDYYALGFPNYESLESSQDDTLSRELAGKNVLDSANHLFTLGAWAPLPGGARGDFAAYYNTRDFDDQPVVNAAGSLTSEGRSDGGLAAAASFSRPFSIGETRFVGELALGYDAADSNQNHYDARKTVFLRDYYDYSQTTIAPRLTLGLGAKPWVLTAGASYSDRRYGERPIQDENGNYLTEKLEVRNTSAHLGVAYPVTKNFKARAVASLGWSDSNMKYEKVFRYNYRIANYLFGFSYEY